MLKIDEGSFASLKSHKGQKLRKYSVKEKLNAVEIAKVKGNRQIARDLNINENRIREWRSKGTELRAFSQPNKRGRIEGGGRHLISEELELRLVAFVENLRSEKL